MAGLLLMLASPAVFGKIIYEERSLYQDIRVSDTNAQRCMQFSKSKAGIRLSQGCKSKKNSHLMLTYSKSLLAALLLNPRPKRILVIGLGIGTIPNIISQTVPDAFIEVVEIDEVVVKVAKKYFGWQESSRVRTYVADGRVFVKHAVKKDIKYDMIILDAFNAEYIPEHLMTLEFLADIRSLLALGGVIAANTFSSSALYDHESVTYEAAFGKFYNVQLKGKHSSRIILGAYPALPDKELIRIAARIYAPHFFNTYGVNVNTLLSKMESDRNWDKNARILTDQYSPANALKGQDRTHTLFRNYFATTITDMYHEHPIPTIIALLCLLMGFMLAIIKLFDIIALKKHPPLIADEKL